MAWSDAARAAALEARRRKASLHQKHLKQAYALSGTIEGRHTLYHQQKGFTRHQLASSLVQALRGVPQFKDFSKWSKGAAAAQAFRKIDRSLKKK